MIFTNPLLLLGLAILVPVIVAFLMKRRRTILKVPSTFLWQAASLRRIKNKRIRHLTKLLALLACLAGIALVTMAAAQPGSATPSRTIAIVVDVSASMGRGDDGSPLAQARDAVSGMLFARAEQEQFVIIAAGDRPLRLAGPTRSSDLLTEATERIRPENGGADLGTAIDLAVALVRGQPEPSVYIFHDGGASNGAAPRSSAGDDGVIVYERIFTPEGEERDLAHNVGIITLAGRRPSDAEDEDERELLVAIATSSPTERTVTLTIEAFDTELVERNVAIPAGGVEELRFRVRTPAQQITARVRPADNLPDRLTVDDAATVTQGDIVPPRVVLIAPEDAPEGETFFVTQALRAAGVEEIVEATPAQAAERTESQDVVVVLSQAPAESPNAPVLFIGTRGSGETLPVENQRELVSDGDDAEGTPTRVHSSAQRHPLLRGVELEGVTIDRALAVDVPDGARPLVELEGGPVVITGGEGADGWVYIGLDPTRSDLVLRVAFPVLISNALGLLGGATQVALAETVPRSEVSLRSGPELDAADAPEAPLRIPRSPSLWLALLGAMLLGVEAIAWRKGWTR